MDNEALIIEAATQTGEFFEVRHSAPTGACNFPLFVLELSDDMDMVEVLDPHNTSYDVDEVYTVIIATRAEPGKERAAKAKLSVLLKNFLGRLYLLVDDNTKFRLREFERYPFVLGGKNVMIGRAEISRLNCFDINE